MVRNKHRRWDDQVAADLHNAVTNDAKSLVNWQYAKLPVSADPAGFGPFEDLVRIWNDKRGPSGELPARKDFDFIDFRSWLGKISIAKVERDPFQIRFVLWGTQLTEWWGVDYTNKVLGEASISPEAWNDVEGRYFQIMDQFPFIGVVSGYLDQHDRPYVKVMGIDLPLTEGNGLSHVISAHIEIEPDDTAESILNINEPLEYI